MSILDRDNYPTSTFSRAQMQQYRSLKRTRLSQSHSRVFTPSAVQQITTIDVTGSTFNSVKPIYGFFDVANPPTMSNMWVYIDYPDVDAPTDELSYDLEMTCHITCKNVR